MTVDYGTDLDWNDDLDKTGRTVTGNTLLAQAVYRRLNTAQGSCLDCPDDGLDVCEYLSLGMTSDELQSVPGQIEGEITKDERIPNANAILTPIEFGFDLHITCTPSDGPDFELTISVTQAGAKLTNVNDGGG